MDFDNLAPELRDKAKNCETPEQLLATLGQGMDPALVIAIETVTAIVAVAILLVFGISLLVQSNRVEDVSM